MDHHTNYKLKQILGEMFPFKKNFQNNNLKQSWKQAYEILIYQFIIHFYLQISPNQFYFILHEFLAFHRWSSISPSASLNCKSTRCISFIYCVNTRGLHKPLGRMANCKYLYFPPFLFFLSILISSFII